MDEAKKHILNLLLELEELRGGLAIASNAYLEARKFINEIKSE